MRIRFLLLASSLLLFCPPIFATDPLYPDAAYGSESVTLQNAQMRLEIHKRITGWGWVEIYNPAGQLIAVLEHLGEASPVTPGIQTPLRIEAQRYSLEKGSFGQRITFPVSMKLYDVIASGRFPNPATLNPLLEGTVTLTLLPDAPRVKISYDYKPTSVVFCRYLHGPWLKVGAGSFGTAKTDGIFPGVEWLQGEEWSSGTDYFQHPMALRVVPHPFKATAPLMALSYQGTGIGLSWDPNSDVMPGKRFIQPVYASPNFIDRQNNQLMGLSLPSVAWGMEENSAPVHSFKPPAFPLELRPELPIHMDAEVFLAKGNAFDVMMDWVKRNPLPAPAEPRYTLKDAAERIATAYNTHLFQEGKGWGRIGQPARPSVPAFVEAYVKRFPTGPITAGLKEKIAWAQRHDKKAPARSRDEALQRGRELLSRQRADGSFVYVPDPKRDLIVIGAAWYKPFSGKNDTSLETNIAAVNELLKIAEETGESQFRDAARKALDYCLSMVRPEGSDEWETPLHAANLLAAGHAASTYYAAYKTFQDPRYLQKSIHWARTLLVFTHLWQPEERPMLYNTKPCLDATDWYLSSWVDNHVQWEVLQSFAGFAREGPDFAKLDQDIDWNRYHLGITTAAFRWMVDHTDRTHRISPPAGQGDLAKAGKFDTLFFDVHDSVTGDYKGALIDPGAIGMNVLALLDRK